MAEAAALFLLVTTIASFMSVRAAKHEVRQWTQTEAKGAIALNALESMAVVWLWHSSTFSGRTIVAAVLWASELYYAIESIVMIGREFPTGRIRRLLLLGWCVVQLVLVPLLAYAS